MDFVTDFYVDLGFPLLWTEEGKKGRELEIQFKSESGYFVSARFVPRKDYVVLKDEWGRELKLRPTRGNLKQVKGWSESRE